MAIRVCIDIDIVRGEQEVAEKVLTKFFSEFRMEGEGYSLLGRTETLKIDEAKDKEPAKSVFGAGTNKITLGQK